MGSIVDEFGNERVNILLIPIVIFYKLFMMPTERYENSKFIGV